jgi:hypothetical protein
VELMPCTGCGQPGRHLHALLTPDGVHLRCGCCLIQLLADVERAGTRLVLTVEPVLAVA